MVGDGGGSGGGGDGGGRGVVGVKAGRVGGTVEQKFKTETKCCALIKDWTVILKNQNM